MGHGADLEDHLEASAYPESNVAGNDTPVTITASQDALVTNLLQVQLKMLIITCNLT